MVSAQEIIKDRKIVERESFLNLSRLSYLHAKILVLFAISAIQTLSFVLVGNAVLEIRGMVFHHWAMFFTMSCVANLIGLNISSGVNSVVTANSVIPFIVVPQLLFSGVMIPFDRLNKVFENPEIVPFIGELMPSRWAYEAVAVHQFKGNKFTREFYKIDRDRSNAIYHNYIVRQLEAELNELHTAFHSSGGVLPESSFDRLALVQNELNELGELNLVASFGKLEEIGSEAFAEPHYQSAMDSLRKAEVKLVSMRNRAEEQREELSVKLIQEWGGEQAFNEMKNRHTNRKLEEMLENKLAHVVVWNNRYVRKESPIYQLPNSKAARAQLYAPVKRVGSVKVDTYWFNMLILWFSALQLYIILANDLPRRFSTWNQVRKLRKRT